MRRAMRRASHLAWGCSGAGRLLGRLGALALALVALVALAACSASGGSSSGGINYSLGLQGSTADHPAQAPSVASGGPSGEYAFVYDNQVWVTPKGASAPVQVTRLTLSNGATLVWGPLAWSPSGDSLAFALVQNLATDQPTQSAGSIYYVDLSKCLSASGTSCPTYDTGATGGVYGRGYSWLNDDWIISGGGSGLLAYDVADPNGWRAWQLRTTVNEQQDANCGQTRSYGDTQVVGSTLYYTCLNLGDVGATGAMGTATLNSLDLSPIISAFGAPDQTTRDEQIAQLLNGDQLSGAQVASLGSVYPDDQGNPVAGAWRVSGTTIVYEQVTGVDSKAGKVSVSLCGTTVYSGGCDSQPLSSVTSQPLTARPQISLGPGGAVAFQGDALYLSGQAAATHVTSFYAPAWVSNGTVAATNITATTTDASGVTRLTTAVVLAKGGSTQTLIAGASDLSLH